MIYMFCSVNGGLKLVVRALLNIGKYPAAYMGSLYYLYGIPGSFFFTLKTIKMRFR